MSSSLAAALRDGKQPLWLFDLILPDATRLWSDTAASVKGVGHYEARILTGGWGKIAQRLSDPKAGTIHNQKYRLKGSDDDRSFLDLIESSVGNQIKGSTGQMRLAADGVAEANWWEGFRGRLTEWDWNDFTFDLSFRQADDPLVTPAPKAEWTIGPSTWPLADPAINGETAPLIYGKYNSAAYTNQGFVPVLLVDTTGTKTHLISAGRLKSVLTVYKDGLETADATFSVVDVNGREWSILTWATDPGDAIVTCDPEGYEATGDGTGAIITEPAAQLKHFLINFVFGDHKKGLYATSHDQVDATSFTATSTFFSDRSYVTARRISKRTNPGILIAEWMRSMFARWWWDYPGAGASGKIVVGVADETVSDVYAPPHLAHYVKDALPFAYGQTDRGLVDELTVESVFDEAQGTYLFVYSVAETSRPARSMEELLMRWGPAS